MDGASASSALEWFAQLVAIHPAVGQTDRVSEAVSVGGGRRHADAETDAFGQAGCAALLFERHLEIVGLSLRFARVAGEEEKKFVAAPADDVVGFTHLFAQQRPNRLEDLI